MQGLATSGIALIVAGLVVGPVAADPLAVSPQTIPVTILGVDVSLPVSGQVDVHTEAGKFVVKAHVTANLADLQAKALQIAKAIKLPTDRCANKNGANAVVDSIDDAALAADGHNVKLSLAGEVSGYACLAHVGYTDLGSGQVRASAAVKIAIAEGKTIGLALDGPVSVDGDGVAGKVIGLLHDQVSSSITDAVAKALDTSKAKAAFPNLPEVDLVIENAQFFAEDKTLMLEGDAMATMTADAFATLLSQLQKH
ncbi:MAG: hypothetical protein P4M09_24285 [Devosia sp.]|nr:hypothetical protein [Devosia sp.]